MNNYEEKHPLWMILRYYLLDLMEYENEIREGIYLDEREPEELVDIFWESEKDNLERWIEEIKNKT